MAVGPGVLRRGLHKTWDTIQWIRTGDQEMHEVYGPNPNALTPGETVASAALISLGLFVASGA